jgi:alcohol dehydrogenase class IV
MPGVSPFTFTAPPTLRFGWGEAVQIPAEAAQLGRRPLVVAGRALRAAGRLEPLLDALRGAGLDPATAEGVPAEPKLSDLQRVMDACTAAEADLVIAVGGGSVLDIAKGAATLAGVGPTAEAFFAGAPLPESGRPIIAVPTTSGTGSEVTRVCVLADPGNQRKASIRTDAMMPRVAIVDPELTVSCPPTVTAYSGADAFVQAVEAFVSAGANPMTDALALEAALLAARALPTAVADGSDRPAREAMALASTMAGLALNTARLGLVHGIAHPAGAVTGAAHGLLCGLLLPYVIAFNLPVAAPKYAVLAREIALVAPDAPVPEAADAFLTFTRGLLREVGIPERLRDVGFPQSALDHVAAETMPSGSTRANPRPVSLEDARDVCRAAM